jgi:hypothetical protein
LLHFGEKFPERVVDPIRIDDLPSDAPELVLSRKLAEYGEVIRARTANLPPREAGHVRLTFVGLQQRLLSSIAALPKAGEDPNDPSIFTPKREHKKDREAGTTAKPNGGSEQADDASLFRNSPRRGRPKGSTVALEDDPQKFAIAMWHGVYLCGYGPYRSAYWAAWLTSDQPIKAEDVEGLLTVAGTESEFTASSLDKHIDRLARKAESIPVDSCVRSTDCAITRHCSLASSRAWLGSLGRRCHALVTLLPVHHRPGDARRLVR